eukprot:763490-Hanusia_phi.AAC.1
MLLVSPHPDVVLENIEKAIMASDLGLNPNNDGAIIRISIPPLTAETRQNYIKQAKNVAEEGKVRTGAFSTSLLPLSPRAPPPSPPLPPTPLPPAFSPPPSTSSPKHDHAYFSLPSMSSSHFLPSPLPLFLPPLALRLSFLAFSLGCSGCSEEHPKDWSGCGQETREG